jgi:tetratricopeptide (TPR) repeat protein
LHFSLRDYYVRSDLVFNSIEIILFGILTIFSFVVPINALLFYATMLFTLGFLHILLVVDNLAWMPFAMTHTVFANGFAIPLAVVSARLALKSPFFVPNNVLLVVILLWWASVLFHFFFSESFVFSYLGGIERQMGMMYRLTLPIYMFSAWQIFNFMSSTFVFIIFIVGAIVETAVLTLQFLDEEKHIKYPFSYLKSIGFRRYTGTISNPIPVANFLVTVLPLSFALYKPNYEFAFFVISYLAISWGLTLSHGRGSYLATSMVSVLEIIYLLVLSFSVPLYMTIIALIVVIAPPIYYLFTPQGKVMKNKLKDVMNFAKRKVFKSTSTKGNGESQAQKPESSNVNRAFIWREAIRAFKGRPLLGYGISNIARALRNKFSRRSASYFMTQVIDRCHNHYLDLLIEGGITHLIIYLTLISLAIYYSLANGMPWIAIAIVGYSFDLLFSFPLQINYFVLMVIASISMGIRQVSHPFVGYVILAMIIVYLVNLYFSSKNNTAMRYVQLATSAQRQGDVKVALDSALSALKTAPFEQRFFTQSSNVLEVLSSTGKLQLENLHTFRIWFNASKNFILKTAEAPDVPFATMAMVYSVVFAATKDKTYGNECWSLTKTALKMNPSSLMARRALFTLLNTLAKINLENKNTPQALSNFKQAEAVLRGIINDFLNAPGPNYDLENTYWQAYFDILKKLNDYDRLKKYFETYKERFKTILFTYDIFNKISKVFNTPVAWTVINTNGTRFLHPVNTVLGPLAKRVWKFSHGKSAELYLTVGEKAKITEDSIRPFIEEFKKQEWWTYWKDEGFVE